MQDGWVEVLCEENSRSRGNSLAYNLVICQAALLRISRILHIELILGISCGSSYVQWISCDHSVNPWAPLWDCTTVEQRKVMGLLWSDRVKLSDIDRIMLAQYEQDCITQREVYQWVERFQSGTKTVIDEDHQGRPNTSWTADNFKRVNTLVQEDRRIIVTDTADKLDISCGSACSVIHEDLGCHKICTRCIPKHLTYGHKRTGMETCMQFLERYHEEGETFLQLDETC
jgi:hypothetical protein